MVLNGSMENTMNAEKTGKLIHDARVNKNLTQKQLAEIIGVTDKAVCKWEKGHGCPDITLLRNLSVALEIDIQSILRGELGLTKTHGGNMKRIKFYRCLECGNLITSTKEIELSCCGNRLESLSAAESNDSKEFEPEINEYDGQFTVKFNHPMVKDNYISNIISVQYDRCTVINLFAEQEALVTIPQIRGIKLYVVTNNNELKEVRL